MKILKLSNLIVLLLSLLILVEGCIESKQVAYFKNSVDTIITLPTLDNEPIIQKNDILSIQISSLNENASLIFNTPNHASTITSTNAGNTEAGGYLVDNEGNIQLPILGNIKAAGITKSNLKNNILQLIISKNLLVDPVITIRHLNFEVTIIGEVGKPTVINVPNEKISILKSLGIAGDITVYGKKNNVLLIREIDNKRKIIRIDLGDKGFLQSPYYYLAPNDIVYVEPNKQKVRNANVNQQLVPTILSGLSIVAVIISQLIK